MIGIRRADPSRSGVWKSLSLSVDWLALVIVLSSSLVASFAIPSNAQEVVRTEVSRNESSDQPNAVSSQEDTSDEFRPIEVPEIYVRERAEHGYITEEEVSAPTRLPAPVRDVPQSVEVITRKLMDDQKAVRIQDVIRNVSGAFINSTGGGRQDFINIRGFSSGLNIFKNGFRDDV